ncbi:MAG: uracil phosphoribosyltransferase [Acidobacteriota bacterium]
MTDSPAHNVTVVDHPLVQHKLTQMRITERSTSGFRQLLKETSMLLAYEITRDAPLTTRRIETPLEAMDAPVLEGKKMVLAAILRAGVGMLDGMLEIMPSARVGHVGLYRDPKTLEAVEYYLKMPEGLHDREVLMLDPMLATGNTAIAATDKVVEMGPKSIKFVCLLAAPEGLEAFHKAHPNVPVYTAAIDRQLNEKGYILPGLGDAGDRIFGTK